MPARTKPQSEPEIVLDDPSAPALPEQDPNALVLPPEPPAPEPEKTFTAAEIEAARRQEKDKLYGELEKERKAREEMDARLAVFEKEREDQQKLAEKERKAQEAEARRLAEEEMSVRELLSQKEQEWESRFTQVDQDRAALAAALDMERQFQALTTYRQARIEERSDELMPELLDMIGGNTQEEIDASIDVVAQKTASILSQVAAAQQQQRQQTRMVSPTGAPPVGPMEQEQSFEKLTPEQIKTMPMGDYAKNRDRIMAALSQQVRNRGGAY